MGRTILDAQLQEIRAGLTQLGKLVETALDQSLQAVHTGDLSVAALAVISDDDIDTFRREVERHAFKTLTLQQPLAGRDLRFLSSTPSIAGDLERAGDNAAGIATLLLRMAPLRTVGRSNIQVEASQHTLEGHQGTGKYTVTEQSIIDGILELGKQAQRVLHETMHAFSTSDARTAHTIWQEDDVVDVCYHMVRHDIMTFLSAIHAIPALEQDALVMQRTTYWLWIAHNLERVGDHCTNICERLVFVFECDTNMHLSED